MEKIAVTGATGFLGSHLVELLLKEGYRVRGVVRDPSRGEKVAHLRKLAQGAAHPLELVAGDVLEPGSHDAAFAGCEAVFHMASSVRLQAKDPQAEIVDVAAMEDEGGLRQRLRAVLVAGERFVGTCQAADAGGGEGDFRSLVSASLSGMFAQLGLRDCFYEGCLKEALHAPPGIGPKQAVRDRLAELQRQLQEANAKLAEIQK